MGFIIPNIGTLEDKRLVLADVLEDGYATKEMTNVNGKAHCLTARYNGAVWQEIGRSMYLSES